MSVAFHTDTVYEAHQMPPGHPERPARIRELVELQGMVAGSGIHLSASSRRATDEELLRVHTEAVVRGIDATSGRPYVMIDPDTHTSAASSDTARSAAGALLGLVDAVMEGNYQRAFAGVRPPGHHAERHRSMGFCLFNNVAVAAAHLVHKRGLGRVCVVDWDVHHGNGTQHIFYDDPSVLFASLHQYPFYPGTGSCDEQGGVNGSGYTLNVPLPAGCTDADYVDAMRTVVVPVMQEYAPEFVLVSCGFDAHQLDPLGGMRMTDAGFDAMTRLLTGVANETAKGRLVAVLEGGYSLSALKSGTETVLRAMCGDAYDAKPIVGGVTGGGEAAVGAALRPARRHWKV